MDWVPSCLGYIHCVVCAGPTPATLGDFWRLIWEEDSRTIVMLTNTQEKGQVCCESNLSVSLCFWSISLMSVCLSVLLYSFILLFLFSRPSVSRTGRLSVTVLSVMDQ